MNDKSPVPKVLWIAIISLAIFSLIHFIIGFSKPLQFIAFTINIVLIIGLLRLAKWAYFLSIIAACVAPFSLSLEGTLYFYIILLLNLTVLVPVLICTKSFFSKDATQPETL